MSGAFDIGHGARIREKITSERFHKSPAERSAEHEIHCFRLQFPPFAWGKAKSVRCDIWTRDDAPKETRYNTEPSSPVSRQGRLQSY